MNDINCITHRFCSGCRNTSSYSYNKCTCKSFIVNRKGVMIVTVNFTKGTSQKWHLNTKLSLVSFTGSMMLFSKINTVYRKEEVMSFSSQFWSIPYYVDWSLNTKRCLLSFIPVISTLSALKKSHQIVV